MQEQIISKSLEYSLLVGLLVFILIVLAGAILFLYKEIQKKDVRNREDTNVQIVNLRTDMTELKEERKVDKKIIGNMVDTNKQLSETNAKLHSAIVGVGDKIDIVSKKVDKIETIIEMKNK